MRVVIAALPWPCTGITYESLFNMELPSDRRNHGPVPSSLGSPGSASGKEPACQCRRCWRHGFDPWAGMIPWRRTWQPTPVLLPGESHGQRSLVGYSPGCHKESDTTKATSRVYTHPTISTLTNYNFLMEKEMATQSSVLAYETPWTEEPGRLQSMRSQKSQTRLSNIYNFVLKCWHC